MKKFAFAFSVIAVAAALFTSCQKHDPAGSDELSQLKALILDQDGNVIFDQTTVSGLYEMGAESNDDATALAAVYAGNGFKGSNYTRTLAGQLGTVKVQQGTNGVFYSIIFNVTDIPSFTLDLKDGNDENSWDLSGNSGTWHKCDVCHRQWKSANINICPWTPVHPDGE